MRFLGSWPERLLGGHLSPRVLEQRIAPCIRGAGTSATPICQGISSPVAILSPSIQDKDIVDKVGLEAIDHLNPQNHCGKSTLFLMAAHTAMHPQPSLVVLAMSAKAGASCTRRQQALCLHAHPQPT